MKKVFLTAAIAATLFTGAFAADIVKGTKVSYQLQSQLTAEFAGIENVKWSATAIGQKADFEVDGVNMTAFFDKQGQYIGYTEDVNFKKLPSAARKDIAAKYTGYMVNQIVKFQPKETANGYERLVGNSESAAYFIDLANDKKEVLLKVTPQSDISLYKQIR